MDSFGNAPNPSPNPSPLIPCPELAPVPVLVPATASFAQEWSSLAGSAAGTASWSEEPQAKAPAGILGEALGSRIWS